MNRFREAYDSSIESVFLIDWSEGRFLDVNETACSYLGYTRDELLRLGPADITPGYTMEEWQFTFDECAEHSEDFTAAIETTYQRRDGSAFPVEMFIEAFNDDGRILHIASARYSSKRVAAQEALAAAQKALEAKELQLQQSQKLEAIGALSAGVTHEFNNLLQVILGFTDVTLIRLTPEHEAFHDLNKAMTAAVHASKLTRQLLSFGRRQRLEQTLVDPNDMVHSLVEMLRDIIEENVEVQVISGGNLGLIILDEVQFQQGNRMKFRQM